MMAKPMKTLWLHYCKLPVVTTLVSLGSSSFWGSLLLEGRYLWGAKKVTQSWYNWAFFLRKKRWQFIPKHFFQNKVKIRHCSSFMLLNIWVASTCLHRVVCCSHKLCKFLPEFFFQPLYHLLFFDSDIIETRNLYSLSLSSLHPHTLRHTPALTWLLHGGISQFFNIFFKPKCFRYNLHSCWKWHEEF